VEHGKRFGVARPFERVVSHLSRNEALKRSRRRQEAEGTVMDTA
jgi:hypothetical protein